MTEYIKNPPYSFFQGEDGKWGTKDKDGNICDKPVYIRSANPDKVNFFHDETGLEVVEFDESEGMSLVAWCSEHWYDRAWEVADYPKEYNDILWKNIVEKRELGKGDIKILDSVSTKVNLSDKELALFDLFHKYLEFENRFFDVRFQPPCLCFMGLCFKTS